MSDDSLVHYAEHCFGQRDLLYGAYVDGQMAGAAELRSNSAIWSEQAPFGRHIQAEAAFSVEEPYRRRGIGEKLFKRIQRAATNHGVETIEIICLPDNVGMRMLAQKLKTHFTFEEGRLKAAACRPRCRSSARLLATCSTLARPCSTPRWRAINGEQGNSA